MKTATKTAVKTRNKKGVYENYVIVEILKKIIMDHQQFIIDVTPDLKKKLYLAVQSQELPRCSEKELTKLMKISSNASKTVSGLLLDSGLFKLDIIPSAYKSKVSAIKILTNETETVFEVCKDYLYDVVVFTLKDLMTILDIDKPPKNVIEMYEFYLLLLKKINADKSLLVKLLKSKLPEDLYIIYFSEEYHHLSLVDPQVSDLINYCTYGFLININKIQLNFRFQPFSFEEDSVNEPFLSVYADPFSTEPMVEKKYFDKNELPFPDEFN